MITGSGKLMRARRRCGGAGPTPGDRPAWGSRMADWLGHLELKA